MSTKKTLATLFTFLLLGSISYAQVHFDWAMHFGGSLVETVNDMAVDNEGNVYATGKFNSDPADFDPTGATYNMSADQYGDIYLAKYGPNGLLDWAFQVGNPSYTDVGNAVDIDQNGNIVMAGGFTGNADFDPGTGNFYLGSNGSEDCYIATYDPQGNFISAFGFGNTGTDYIADMALDNAGNRYVIGRFAGTVDFDPDPVGEYLVQAVYIDLFMAKYTASGDFVWAYNFGGDLTDDGLGLTVEPATGDVCITGFYSGTADFDPGIGFASLVSNGYDDIFLARYDTDANLLYAYGFGSSEPAEKGTDVQFDHQGNVIITGVYDGIIDFDPGSGTHQLAPVSSAPDIFFAKYSSTGDFVFAGSLGGSGNEMPERIAVDSDNNIYLTGSFNSYNPDFDPSADTAYLPDGFNNDAFVAKYTPMGEYMWAGSFTGTLQAEGRALEHNGEGILVGGGFAGQASFDFVTGGAPMQAPGTGTDSFIAFFKVDCNLNMNVNNVEGTLWCDFDNGSYQWVDCDDNFEPVEGATNPWFTPTESGNYAVIVDQFACTDTSECVFVNLTGMPENSDRDAVRIYPNPATDRITVETSSGQAIEQLILLDLSGRVIFRAEPTSLNSNCMIDLHDQQPGVYLLQCQTAGTIQTSRIIKK